MTQNTSRRGFMVGAATVAAAGASWPLLGRAAAYPERAIRLVVPFAPGGDGDVMGRYWAKATAAVPGYNIVVDNKGGAGGAIGAVEVARAKPDGYTLLLGTTTTQIVNPLASTKPLYDGLKDFVMVAAVSANPTCIMVNPSQPVTNLKELIALAKAQPGKLSYGSAGAGTITNLTGELFKYLGGKLDITHVPYRGGGPVMSDVMAGHLPMGTPILSSAVLAQHRAGKVRILAINSPQRLKAAPDIPTAVESGLADMQVVVFNAVFAPAGLPQPVLASLRQVGQQVQKDKAFAADIDQSGAEMLVIKDQDKYMKDEFDRWSRLIKATGFKIDE